MALKDDLLKVAQSLTIIAAHIDDPGAEAAATQTQLAALQKKHQNLLDAMKNAGTHLQLTDAQKEQLQAMIAAAS